MFDSEDSLHLAALRAELKRLRQSRLPRAVRNPLIERLIAAIRSLEGASREPELASWWYHWRRLSTRRAGLLVTCWAAGVCMMAVVLSAGRGGVSESIYHVAFLASVVGGVFVGMPLLEGLERRRKIHGARRLATRLASGRRRTRAEAEGDPFVGPAAVDLLTFGSAALGVVAGRSGFITFGMTLAVAPVLIVAATLADRRRVMLGLPATYQSAKRVTAPVLLGAVAAAFVVDGWEGSARLADAVIFTFASLFLYTGYVGLADERVGYGYRSFVTRDERPLFYWLLVVALFCMAIGLLVMLISYRRA